MLELPRPLWISMPECPPLSPLTVISTPMWFVDKVSHYNFYLQSHQCRLHNQCPINHLLQYPDLIFPPDRSRVEPKCSCHSGLFVNGKESFKAGWQCQMKKIRHDGSYTQAVICPKVVPFALTQFHLYILSLAIKKSKRYHCSLMNHIKMSLQYYCLAGFMPGLLPVFN